MFLSFCSLYPLKYEYQLDVAQMDAQEKEELLGDVLTDVARIRVAVFERTNSSPSVATVVDAYAQAEGDQKKCLEILIRATPHGLVVTSLPVVKLSPPPPARPPIRQQQVLITDASTFEPPPLFADQPPAHTMNKPAYSPDWPLDRAEEDTRAMFCTLRDYIADPARLEAEACQALKVFLDDDYVPALADHIDTLGWDEDDPTLTPAIAQSVVAFLSPLAM